MLFEITHFNHISLHPSINAFSQQQLKAIWLFAPRSAPGRSRSNHRASPFSSRAEPRFAPGGPVLRVADRGLRAAAAEIESGPRAQAFRHPPTRYGKLSFGVFLVWRGFARVSSARLLPCVGTGLVSRFLVLRRAGGRR